MSKGNPLSLLLLDGGNPGKASFTQSLILEELSWRLDDEPLTDSFDVIGGSGFGGFLAILATVFRTPIEDMVKLYKQLYDNLFTLPTWEGPNIDKEANSVKLVEIIRHNLPHETLDSWFTWRRGAPQMFPTLLCCVNPNDVAHARILSTCRTKERSIPCTVIDALRICLTDGFHLPAVPLTDPPEWFIGAGHRFSNPILDSLKEIQSIFGASQSLSCIVSIGTGEDRVLSVNESGRIVTDCRWWADHWETQCSDLDGFLYRFNLTGSDSARQGDLSAIKTDTKQYLLQPECSSLLDMLTDRLVARENVVAANELVSLGERGAGTRIIKEVHENQLDEKAKKIREWLSPSDPTNHELVSIREVREPGTGRWFLESEVFTAWLAGTSPLFLLDGIPGAGKTYFAQLVHDHLRKVLQESRIAAYFIKSGQKLSDKQILSSILSQTFATMDDIPPNIHMLFKTEASPDLADLKSALKEKSTDLPLFIVLDALDEFEVNSRAKLMRTLRGLGPKIRIFVTARYLPSKIYAFDVTHHFDLAKSDVDDLRKYIHERLGREASLETVLEETPELQSRILVTVLDRCANMFLLANLHMNQISQCRSLFAIDKLLPILPRTVESTYFQAIDRINQMNEQDARHAMHALMWVFYDLNPWAFHSIRELQDAVAASSEDIVGYSITTARIDGATLLSLCGGLLVATNNDVTFVHLTAYQFFMSNHKTIFGTDPHAILATGCLRFILANWPGEGLQKASQYCVQYCASHCRSAQIKPLSLLMTFYANERLFSWCCRKNNMHGLRNTPNPLHFTAYIGATPLIRTLLPIFPINSRDSDRTTPLHLAAKHGYLNMVQLLLSFDGVDPDPQDIDGRTPFFLASQMGCKEVVQLLLSNKNVDINSRDTDGHTPLCFAAVARREEIVKLLLTCENIDPDSYNTSRRTPLSIAAGNGLREAVKQFLGNTNVDPDFCDHSRRTPLSYAAENGHEEVVKLLLTKETVDPDSGDDSHRTPLSFAAENGHEEVVKLLLTKETVDPDSGDDSHRTPLSFAAENGHEEVVKLLLTKETVDPDSGNDSHRTPLSFAAENGHEEVVKLLLTKETVDPDSGNDSHRTPLSFAAENGYEEVVKLLLTKETVDPDSRDHSHRTPLSFAAGNGHQEVVKLLLTEEIVDPDSRDHSHRTPLSFAAGNGHQEVVKLLLTAETVDPDTPNCSQDHDFFADDKCLPHYTLGEKGKGQIFIVTSKGVENPDAYNNSRRTPLSLAAENGHQEVVRLLLSSGKVDPNSKNNSRRTPLSYAAANGHQEVVKQLIGTKRVELEARTRSGRTPLSLAAQSGHQEVVKLLIDTKAVDINSAGRSERTPFYYAAQAGHKEVVQILLSSRKVDPQYPDFLGNTALSIAVEAGRKEIVQLLLSHDEVDPNWRNEDGCTPLSLAAVAGNGEVVQLLISTSKIDMEPRDNIGRTPLILFAKSVDSRRDCWLRTIALLLVQGKGDINARDDQGKTALYYAKLNKYAPAGLATRLEEKFRATL